MSEIVENYQEEQQLEEQKAPEYSFATIGDVYDDGISLIFPGAEEASEKHYRANLYCKFSAGQRVYLAKDSGTYVVLFPVGIPGSKEVKADSATTATKADSATTATKADTATTANSASKADTAESLATKRTISLTGAVTGSGTFDGSQNVEITTAMSSHGGTVTADSLKTARKISLTGAVTGNTTFDGSKDVSISTSLSSGINAATATKLKASRKITLGGVLTGNASFDGSADVTLTAAFSNTAKVPTATNFTNKHTGTYLSFFSSTNSTSKQIVGQLTGTATVSTLQTKLNALIKALQNYNLIG